MQPTPRDFSEFVYCGLKWILDKNKDIDKIKKLKSQSYDMSQKNINLTLGQQNEHKCIEWVIRNHRATPQQVIFNGTGNDNHKFLTTVIESSGISMQCKPDLIFANKNQNELYEFKAVSDSNYLNLTEFESYHAQLWCYTTIKEIRIDKYYLLRYFIDPFYRGPLSSYRTYRLIQILHSELDKAKFQELFEQYIKAMNLFKESDKNIVKKLIQDNSPKKESEKQQKCANCIYKRINICTLY